MKLAVVACLHGNELYGVEVVRKLPCDADAFIANTAAILERKRFVYSDLNRCFPGKKDGNFEERLAYMLKEELKDYDYVIDLHSCSRPSPLFGIITKPNEEKIEFARKLGLEKLVIMSEDLASGHSMIDHMKCGISMELGPHERKDNAKDALERISHFLERRPPKEDMEIYEVVGILKKEYPTVYIDNFEHVQEGKVITQVYGYSQFASYDFTAVLTDEEEYPEILCLACKKVY